jgi:hypothetical protein
MSTWLGIKYNLWHGIFGALIQVVVIVSSYWWSTANSLQAQMLSAIGLSTLFNFALQAGNEAFQLKSPNVIKNYGSWENAQANSRDDWKWWLLGTISGTFLGVIIFVFIDKIF